MENFLFTDNKHAHCSGHKIIVSCSHLINTFFIFVFSEVDVNNVNEKLGFLKFF